MEGDSDAVNFHDEVVVDDDLICIVYDDHQTAEEGESDVEETSEDTGGELSGYGSDESSRGVGETFPYMDSETDEDDLPWERRKSAVNADEDVITLEDEEEEQDVLQKRLKQKGHLTCLRCPRDRNEYNDLELFLLHKARHLGRNQFLCVECKKPFIKYSFCLAHEIRRHGQDFPKLEFPAVLLAREYVREKEELKQNAPRVPKQVQWSEEEKVFEEIGGILEVPEDSETDTDEDDPKFYPGHVVPSTSLYPYRGPPITMHYETYKVQLEYGREKRTNMNTVARSALLQREFLAKKGFLPDQDRVSKYHPRQHYLDEFEETLPDKVKSKPAAARRRNGAQKSANTNKTQRRKRNARRKTGDRKERCVRRTFVSAIIRRTCLLCQFTWTTEAELREHRDQRHSSRNLLDLMTVLTETKKKRRKKSGNSDEEEDLFQAIKLPKDLPTVSKYSKGPDPQLEAFLANLGLISVRKLEQLKRPNIGRRLRMSVRKQTKPCRVVLERLSTFKLPTKGHPVFTCNMCDFFVRDRKYLDSHRIVQHGQKAPSLLKPSNSKSSDNKNGSSSSKVNGTTAKRKAVSKPSSGGTPKKKLKNSHQSENHVSTEEPDWQSSTNADVVRSLIGTPLSS